MAKKVKTKFKDLSTEDIVDLSIAAGGDKPAKKAARKEFRKRKKAGTLGEILSRPVDDAVKTKPADPVKKAPVVERTTATTEGTPPSDVTVTRDDSGAEVRITPNSAEFGVEAMGGGVGPNGESLTPEDIASDNLAYMSSIEMTEVPTEERSALHQAMMEKRENVSKLNPALEASAQLEMEKEKEIGRLASIVNGADPTGSEVEKTITTQQILDKEMEIDSYADNPDDPRLKRAIEEYKGMVADSNRRLGEPAIEALGIEQYYPDINRPLQVGAYQGSIVGSNPIFVAGGGYLPMGVVDARKRAIAGAAKDKAARREKLMALLTAKGAVQYQDQIDGMSMEILEKYGNLTGWDFSKLLDMDTELSREFFKEVYEHKAFAERTNRTEARAVDIMKKEGDEKIYVPDWTKRCVDVWNEGIIYKMEEFKADKKKFKSVENCLKSYDNMTYYGNQAVTKIKRDKIPLKNLDGITPEEAKTYEDAYSVILNSNDSRQIASASMVFLDPEKLDNIARAIVGQRDFFPMKGKRGVDNTEASVAEMKTYISSLLGKEIETQLKRDGRFNVQGRIRVKQAPGAEQLAATTIFDQVQEGMTSGDFTNAIVSASVDESYNRAQKFIDAFKRGTGVDMNRRDDGSIYELTGTSMIAPSQQTKQDYPFLPENTLYEGSDGNMRTLSEAKKFIISELEDKEGLVLREATPDENALLNFNPKNPQSATANSVEVSLGVRNPDGTYRVATINDRESDLRNSVPIGGMNMMTVPTEDGGVVKFRVGGDMNNPINKATLDYMVNPQQTPFRRATKESIDVEIPAGEEMPTGGGPSEIIDL